MKSDCLQRFLFDNAPIRGEWVNLQQSWQEVLKRRDYPVAIRRALGQMMGAAALLAATVKMKGRLVLQIRSEGPVTLLMVECTSQNTLRAFAQWQGDVDETLRFGELTSGGNLAITIEVEGARKPYQGIVSIEGDSLSDTLESYFAQSEQLATRIWLFANDHNVAGLLLQQLPAEEADKEKTEEDWLRISQLAATITDQELLTLEMETLLHRLFHEEKVRVFEPTVLSFACSCSRQRVKNAISLLGQDETRKIIESQGGIEVNCELCNEHYHFDKVDVAEIFSDSVSPSSDSNTLH